MDLGWISMDLGWIFLDFMDLGWISMDLGWIWNGFLHGFHGSQMDCCGSGMDLFPTGQAQPSLGHHRRQICFLWAQVSRAWGIIGNKFIRAWGIIGDKFVSYGLSKAEPGA